LGVVAAETDWDYNASVVGHVPKVTRQQAFLVAQSWHAEATQPFHIRDGANSVWALELLGRPVILRLTSEAHRTRQQLEAELAFIDHLAAGGLTVAPALASTTGQRIVEASKIAKSNEPTHAVVFPRLEGRHFEYYSSDISRPLFALWGRTMGCLHALSQNFTTPPALRRPDWPDDDLAGCSLSGVQDDQDVVLLRNELVGWLRSRASEPVHYGMVHGDFERTNFLLHDGLLQIIDFDHCCHHWFCWDIACALWVFRNARREERPPPTEGK
jgi:Ser/Thr protein kinase RdoA (MazF antagonist)